jgi:ectoine hydroxylase-related dioxygenase (phytanoyl-CoA dioxygenase family)
MKPDDLFDHVVEDGTNDKVGYHGAEPGIPVIVPAGSIAVFSSRTFHRSGPNTSDKMRRSYLAQYSAEPILNKEGTAVRTLAVPFLKAGQPVRPSPAG